MSDNALIEIPRKASGPGYIYFVRLHYSKDCYKIGNAKDVFKRIPNHGQFGEVELLAYGFSFNRLLTEQLLQRIFYNLCNNSLSNKAIYDGTGFNFEFRGDINSTEHFILSHKDAIAVIDCMRLLCISTQVGCDNELFNHKKFQDSIYDNGPEQNFYYDRARGFFLNYPTQFKDGNPIREFGIRAI